MEKDGGTFYIDFEEGIVVLQDEEGNSEKFYIELDIEFEGKRYLIVCHEEEVDSGEYIALRLEEEPETGELYLLMVDDEDELDRLQDYLDEMDFDDEEYGDFEE